MSVLRRMLVFLPLVLAACAHPALQVNRGPAGDVELIQGGGAVAPEADGTLVLRAEPFEIRSRWPRVHVCFSRSEAGLGKIAVGVDTWRDEESCFRIGMAYAMEVEADYLVVGDGVNVLNEAHGMRRGDRYYWFPVRYLFDEKSRKDVAISQAPGEYFAAFWVDRNGDRRLDAGEFTLVPMMLEARPPPSRPLAVPPGN